MTHTIEVTPEEQMSAVIDFLNRTGNGDMADKVRDLARHRTEALSTAGEPVAWMYAPIKPLPNHDPYFVQQNRANMDPRFWTETPLYTAPSSQRSLVEALEAVKRSLEDAVCCDETMSHDEAYSEILYFGGTALASAYDKVCAALSLTKAQERPA